MPCLLPTMTGLDSSAGMAWVLIPLQLRARLLSRCIYHEHPVFGYGHILIHKSLDSFCAREAFPNTALRFHEWLLRPLLGQWALISRSLSLPVSWAPIFQADLPQPTLCLCRGRHQLPWALPLFTLGFAITNVDYTEREREDRQSQNPWAINVNVCQFLFRVGCGPWLMLNIYWVPIMDEASSDPLVEQPSGAIENAFLRE